MAIDYGKLRAAALRAHGEMVQVLPPLKGGFSLVMLFDDPAEAVELGVLGGHLSQPVFLCEPAEDSLIVDGTTLTRTDAVAYQVIEGGVTRKANQLTEIRVLER